MTPTVHPPQPVPSIDSQPYWDSLSRGVFALQRCGDCREWQFPNIESCRHCGGALALEPISGRATIYSYIVEHRAVAPGFDHLLPYAIALVLPEEAPHIRLPTRLVDAPLDAVKIGAAVRAELAPLPGGTFTVPVFRLAGD